MQCALSQLQEQALIGCIVNKMVRNPLIRLENMAFLVGITPSLVTTATHETLTVDYPEAKFSTIVTRNVSTIIYEHYNSTVERFHDDRLLFDFSTSSYRLGLSFQKAANISLPADTLELRTYLNGDGKHDRTLKLV